MTGRVVIASVLVATSVAVVPTAAHAAEFDVTTTADAGAGSLRQALLDASDNGTDDVVTIDPTLAGSTITLSTGQLTHSGEDEALTIRGAGVTVDAAGASRVLFDESTGLLTIEDLTVTGGFLDEDDLPAWGEVPPPLYEGELAGAGLFTLGAVRLERSTVTTNVIDGAAGSDVSDAYGAGIYAVGHVDLVDSALTSNRLVGGTPSVEGGGAWSASLYATGSTITDNVIQTTGFIGDGGGVYALDDFRLTGSSTLARNVVDGVEVVIGGGAYADHGLVEDSVVEDNDISGAFFVGGGGLAVENLEIRRSVVRSNTAVSTNEEDGPPASGGAALFVGLVVEDSTIVDNSATGRYAAGGAFGTDFFTANDDGLPRRIVNSTLTGNVAEGTASDGVAEGGALAVTGFRIERSLFAGNAATSKGGGYGGAVATSPSGGDDTAPTLITDSTFVDNRSSGPAGSFGGAVAAVDGEVDVHRSTFSGNEAGEGSAVGLADHALVGASLSVATSALDGSAPACTSEVEVVDHVVATDGSCAGARVVPDAELGALADNGGPTETMLPLPGSPLIDAIPTVSSSCTGTDQRGVARPVGPGCDVGAVETTGPMATIGGWVARLAAGDLDGDDVDDLLGHRPGSPVDAIAWNGDPTVLGKMFIQGDYQPLLGDFDGDGADDIVWYAPGRAFDYIFWADGDRTFTTSNTRVLGSYRPMVGDFDGDGADDIFWYGPGARGDYVWWADGDRTFTSRPFIVRGIYQPIAGDFDGDGRRDIVWYAPGGSADYVWWSRGRTFSSTFTRVSGTYVTTAGDFDGDGADDIVWYGSGSRGDYVWWGARSRRFASMQKGISGSLTPVAGDFDGDGADDVFFHGAGSRADRLYRGTSRVEFLAG